MSNEQERRMNMVGPIGIFLPAIEWMIGWAFIFSTPVALLLRPYEKKWGERALGYASIYAVLGMVAALAAWVILESAVQTGFAFDEYAREVYLFTGFILAFCAVAGIQSVWIWQRHRAGDYLTVHSYERGESFSFWNEGLPFNVTTIQRIFEPTLVALAAIPFFMIPMLESPIFGGFLLVQGLLLAIAENGMHIIQYQRLLDHFDAIITARITQELVEAAEMGSGLKFDLKSVPPPLKVMVEQGDPEVIMAVGERLLGSSISLERIEDPALRKLAGINGSSSGEQLPLENASSSGDE